MDQKLDKLRRIIPVIILNWNGENDTLACLNSFKQSENTNFLAVVVDNGSKQDSLNSLKKGCSTLFRSIVYLESDAIDNSKDILIDTLVHNQTSDILVFIENPENYGFAKGNNIGIKIATFLNSD